MRNILVPNSISTLILAGVVSGTLSMGLVACSTGNDSPEDEPKADTTKPKTDRKSDSQGEETTSGAAVEIDTSTDEPAMDISEDIITLPSGWTANEAFEDNVVVKNPESSEMVMIETMPNTGEDPTAARALAEAVASEDGNAGIISEVAVEGRTWVVVTYGATDNGGVAYSDNEDGSISKLVWSDCTFDDAIAKSTEYSAETESL